VVRDALRLRRDAARHRSCHPDRLAAVARLEPHFDGDRFAYRTEMAPVDGADTD
jgi:hypothetical protein